jgi:hypothetical protein
LEKPIIMPPRLLWTEARDLQLKRMRAEGATWNTIAAALGLSRFATIERGRRIGARKPPPDFTPTPEDPERETLPAGHERTWGAITDGTVLEGYPYPYPVFSW